MHRRQLIQLAIAGVAVTATFPIVQLKKSPWEQLQDKMRASGYPEPEFTDVLRCWGGHESCMTYTLPNGRIGAYVRIDGDPGDRDKMAAFCLTKWN